jgi:hypothetical protein
MNKYCVRIKSHPVWATVGNLRRQQSQVLSQWLIKSAEQIGSMNAQEVNKAIWQVIWQTIINSIIIIVVISLAIYSGYLHYQFPDPQHLDLLLLVGAVSCNILLTQLLNFKYLKTILWFLLLLGSLIAIAHIAPVFDRMLMYLYTSWLLIFIVPIIYGLTVLAFDLQRFRNILIVIMAIVATSVYSLYPIQQFFNWEIEIDFLSIANQISFATIIVCLVIFTIFTTITKILQIVPRIGVLFLREIAK